MTDFRVVTNGKRLLGVLPRAAAIAALFVLAGCGNVVVEATGGDPGTGGAGGSATGGSGGDGGAGGAGGSTTSATTSSTTTSSTETTCGCLVDADCANDFACFACECVECTPSSGDEECGPGLWCCGKSCEDLTADPQNCGECGFVCEPYPHASVGCEAGLCGIGECDAGFLDCDGKLDNGCETNGAGCQCVPGEFVSCYTGPAGTEGVGVCAPGSQECLDGQSLTPCFGEQHPVTEVCDGLDNDCDGLVDEDQDGDGWTVCDGDCCEDLEQCFPPSPDRVNPGAMEIPGNGFDDDCNIGTPDDAPLPTCSLKAQAEMDLAQQATISSLKLVKAMDLCQFTVESPAQLKEKTWGVISTQLTLADGSTAVSVKPLQVGVLPQFGPNVPPLLGETMAVLSSGAARIEGNPGYVTSYNAQTQSPMPAAFLAANGGVAPPGCGQPCNGASCQTAFDPVRLAIRMRVPTNMGGFHFAMRFYTAEYPEGTCSTWNDFFVALLQSQAYPEKVNLAFDNFTNPLSVNSAFFSSCEGCPDGTAALVGTGIGGANGALNNGAATAWHTNAVQVAPGEVIDLDLVIWDAADHSVNSTVLLDGFTWVPSSFFLND